MPAKKYHVYLSDEEREYLERFVSTGANKARRITRARILLLADESKGRGKTDREIAEALGVCMRTVAKTRGDANGIIPQRRQAEKALF
ncbi:MAG: helix-turn-helix domain-containing protein [Candidatus Methanospirareceae archaeon]